MNTIFQSMDPSIAYALGWTIIHSFWQASLIALLMSLIHRIANHKKAAFKYKVSVLSMVSVLLASIFTFAFYYSSTSDKGLVATNLEITDFAVATGYSTSQLDGVKSFFTDNLHHINFIWIVGVALFIARFVFSYLYTKYLRNTALFTNTDTLQKVVNRLKSNLLLNKTIAIGESAKIDVPLVLGHFKPLILFPIGIVNMLTAEEVEAIITHELAHIKRFDYLSNILLTLVEILFYFHPAVWWISANVKAERENCCDDFALSQNIDKVVYAKALVKLEEIKMSRTPSLAMPFSSKKHHLLNRIKRIMNMPQTQNDIKEKSIATILLLSIFLLFNTQVNSKPVPSESNIETPQVTNDTLKIEGKEEMILTVKDGKFESLEIDEEIKEGEIIQMIEETVNKNSTDKKSYTMTVQELPVLRLYNNRVSISGQGGVIYESDDHELESPGIQMDTLPDHSQSNASIIVKKDGKVIELEKENGEITKLKVDGKVIPKSEYDNYIEEIESTNNIYHFDTDENIFHFDDDLSKSFGLLFDGEHWREFGGNFDMLIDSTFMKKLKDMEHMRFDFKELENFERLEGLERLGELEGLEMLRGLEGLEKMEGLENLEELFEELGIQMDSTFSGNSFRFHNFDGLNGFEFFDNFDDDITIFRNEDSDTKRGTVVDKIGRMLNNDGLLKEYKSNKIEITGKHLKINGEKMPKALFEKYKDVYQEATGAPLTKKSKMIFDVEGKPSKRKVRTF